MTEPNRRSSTYFRLVIAALAAGCCAVVAASPAAAAESLNQTVSQSTVQAGDTPLATQLMDPAGVSNPTFQTIVQLTGAHALVPATVKAPVNTTISYSTDGTTYSGSGSSASKYVKFAGPLATGAGAVAPVGASYSGSIAGGSGGDGFSPIITATRIFNVNHHNPTRVECHELSTGAVCAGYPFAVPSGAITGGATRGVIDQVSGHLWVAGQRTGGAKELGFECIVVGQDSTTTPSSCGFVSTGNGQLVLDQGDNGIYGGSISSGDEYGRRLYAIDSDGNIHCVDMAAAAACSGQPYDLGLPNTDGYGAGLTRIGDSSKFIGRTNAVSSGPIHDNGGGPSNVVCFDAATNALCAGWSGVVVMGAGVGSLNGDAISAQTGSGWDTFCGILNAGAPAANLNGTTLTVQCRKLSDGSSESVPAGMNGTGLTNGESGWQFGTWNLEMADTSGTRVYFTMLRYVQDNFLDFDPRTTTDRLVCYDFATHAVCPNFPQDFSAPSGHNAYTTTYATAVDPTGSCVWTLGDSGQMVQHDATTPTQNCVFATVQQHVDRSDAYCGTTPGDVATAPWDVVRIRNVAEGTDYQNAVVTIQDSNGAIVSGFDHAPISGSTIDISAIPATGTTSELLVTVEFGGVQATPFNSGDTYVEVTWDSTQLTRTCLGTTVAAVACDALSPGPGFDATATFAVSGAAPGPDRRDNDVLTRSPGEISACQPPVTTTTTTTTTGTTPTPTTTTSPPTTPTTTTTPVPPAARPVLSITKVADRTRLRGGQQVTYTIRITVSKADATNVVICDALPSGLTYVKLGSARLRSGKACWSLGAVPQGGSRTVRLIARAQTLPAPKTVTNTANVAAERAVTKHARATVRIDAGAVRSDTAGGVTG